MSDEDQKIRRAIYLAGVMQSQSERLTALLAMPSPAWDSWHEDVNALVLQLGATWRRIEYLGLSALPKP